MKGLAFKEVVGGEEREFGRLTISKSGILVWKGADKDFRDTVANLETRAKANDDPEAYLEEVFMYIRSPYLWASKIL